MVDGTLVDGLLVMMMRRRWRRMRWPERGLAAD
jgi:hypothetical protein